MLRWGKNPKTSESDEPNWGQVSALSHSDVASEAGSSTTTWPLLQRYWGHRWTFSEGITGSRQQVTTISRTITSWLFLFCLQTSQCWPCLTSRAWGFHFSWTCSINSNLMGLFIVYQHASLTLSPCQLSHCSSNSGLWLCFWKHFSTFPMKPFSRIPILP